MMSGSGRTRRLLPGLWSFPMKLSADNSQLYLIPGTSGAASIYKNLKGKKMEKLTLILGTPISKDVDVGCSAFPKG